MDDERLRPGSIAQTLAGEADLRVGAVVREAWSHLPGIKLPMLAAGGLVYGGVLLIIGLFGPLLEADQPGFNSVFQLLAHSSGWAPAEFRCHARSADSDIAWALSGAGTVAFGRAEGRARSSRV
jgi:hypothetical protein